MPTVQVVVGCEDVKDEDDVEGLVSDVNPYEQKSAISLGLNHVSPS